MGKIDVRAVSSGSDLKSVQDLCRSFRSWLYERYPGDHAAIDTYYNPANYEKLLSELLVLHAPPEGAIYLCNYKGVPAGCVMMSKISDHACEMKRLFVAPAVRGKGVGNALCASLFAAAREAGYLTMHLDTGPFHAEAKALYAKLGFVVCDAHYNPGPDWRDRLIFMKRDLIDPLGADT